MLTRSWRRARWRHSSASSKFHMLMAVWPRKTRRERVVGPGCESYEQAFLRFFQHANVIENQSLPDARGMAARIETEGPGESAQSKAILKFSCRRPEDAAFRAVCLRIIGV